MLHLATIQRTKQHFPIQMSAFFIALFGAIFAWFFIFYSSNERASLWTYLFAVFVFILTYRAQQYRHRPSYYSSTHHSLIPPYSFETLATAKRTSLTQLRITLASFKGCRPVTSEILYAVSGRLGRRANGIASLFLQSSCATFTMCSACNTTGSASLALPVVRGALALADDQHLYICGQSCMVCR